MSPQSAERFETVRSDLKQVSHDAPARRDEYEKFVDKVMDADLPTPSEGGGSEVEMDMQRIMTHLQGAVDREQEDKDQDSEILEVTKQKMQNLQLLVALNDNEEGIRNEHGKLMERCENARLDLDTRFRRGEEHLKQFDEGTKCAVLSKYSAESLVQDCPLGMSVKEVTQLDSEPLTDTDTFRRLLTELTTTKAAKRRKEFLEQSMTTAINRAEDNNVLNLIFPMYDMLHSDLLSTDHIKDNLRAYDDRVAALEKEIQHTERLRQTALTDNDLKQAEEHHDTSIALQEQLLELGRERLQTLTKQSQAKLLEDLHTHHQAGVASLQNAQKVQKELIKRVESDATKLAAKEKKEKEIDKREQEQFEEFRKDNDEKLQKNAEEQQQLLGKIIQMFKDIDALGGERVKAVQQRVEATQKEEKRVRDTTQLQAVAKAHKEQLESIKHKADTCIDAITATEGFLNDTEKRIHKKVEACDAELQELRVKEHERMFTIFRRYYLCVGELLYRKDKRMGELHRTARSCDLQLQMCRETLDEEEGRYIEEQKNLERIMEKTNAKVEVLKDKLEGATEQFKFTEEALDAAGKSYVHPAVELQELNVERSSKALALRQQYQERENNDVDTEAKTIKTIAEITSSVKKSPQKKHADLTPRRLDKTTHDDKPAKK